MTNEAIRVKALEWTEDEPHHDQIDARVFVTVGSLGGYSIHVRTAGAIHSFNDDEMVGMTHDTLEEAKAACQADFARRVGECVEVDDVGNTVAIQARCAELASLVRNEVLPALDATGVNISLAADLRAMIEESTR